MIRRAGFFPFCHFLCLQIDHVWEKGRTCIKRACTLQRSSLLTRGAQAPSIFTKDGYMLPHLVFPPLTHSLALYGHSLPTITWWATVQAGSLAMQESRDTKQPTDSCIIENDNKSELPSQLKTGSVTVVDLASPSPTDNFNSGWRFYASFISLCIITLAVALDATSLSVALPVKTPSLPLLTS